MVFNLLRFSRQMCGGFEFLYLLEYFKMDIWWISSLRFSKLTRRFEGGWNEKKNEQVVDLSAPLIFREIKMDKWWV